MTQPFSDELISAYLDGELTPEQRALVEQQLQERADLRRMRDDLLLLRRTLQTLPVAQPPDNLPERVLRQAERRVLAGERAGAGAGELSPEQAVAAPRRSSRRLSRAWGGVAMVVAAVAAVGLVMIVLQDGRRDVALAPADAPSEERLAEKMDKLAAGGQYEPALPSGEVRVWSAPDEDVSSRGVAMDVQAADRAEPVERSMRFGAQAEGMLRSAPSAPPAGGGGSYRFVNPNSSGGEAKLAPEASGRANGLAETGGMGGMGRYYGAGGAAKDMDDSGMGAGAPPRSGSSVLGFGSNAVPTGPGGMGASMPAAAPAPGMPLPAAVPPPPAMAAPSLFGAAPGAASSSPGLVPPPALAETDLPASTDVVEQIVSQLNRDQMLLVRVQLPEEALSSTLVDLSNANRTNVLTTGGAVVPVQQVPMADDTSITRAAGQAPFLQVPARDETEMRQLQLGLMTPNTVIVDGSSAQIRQSLNDLSARRGVEIEPVTLDLAADRYAAPRQSATAEGMVDEKMLPAAPPRQAALGRSGDGAKTRAKTQEDVQQKAETAPVEESEAAGAKRTIVYLLLRLWNESAARPATEPTTESADQPDIQP